MQLLAYAPSICSNSNACTGMRCDEMHAECAQMHTHIMAIATKPARSIKPTTATQWFGQFWKKKPNARCILSSCLLLGCNLILHFSRARSPSGWVTFVAAPKNTTTTKPMVVFDWARFVALNMYIIHNFVQMFAIGIDRQASTTTAPLNSIGATTKKCQLICYPASPFYPNKTHTISIILVKCWMLRDFCSPIIVMWLWPSHGCVCVSARVVVVLFVGRQIKNVCDRMAFKCCATTLGQQCTQCT